MSLLSARRAVIKLEGIPREGLVGEWLFKGNPFDTSGNGNNGTVNGAILTTDRHSNPNSAYLFDGINDYISVPYAAVLFNGVFSYSIWVKFITWNPAFTNNWMVNSWNSTTPRVDGMYIISSASRHPRLVYRAGSASNVMESTQNIGLGVWHHIVVIHGASADFLYIDGAPISTTYEFGSFVAGIDASTPPTFFGARTDISQFTNLAISDTRKYNIELTQADVTALFNE